MLGGFHTDRSGLIWGVPSLVRVPQLESRWFVPWDFGVTIQISLLFQRGWLWPRLVHTQKLSLTHKIVSAYGLRSDSFPLFSQTLVSSNISGFDNEITRVALILVS